MTYDSSAAGLSSLLEIHHLIYFLDFVGVFACTTAATVLAKQLKFDLFGCIFISFIASVSGGTFRDLLIDRHPIFWLKDLHYFYAVIGVSVVVQLAYGFFARISYVIRGFDALGLAAFTVIGLEAALNRGLAYPIAVLMGALTAVLGGLLRDIVCREIPLVLRQEIYITASLAGSSFYLLTLHLLDLWSRSVATILLIFGLRMLAVHYRWNLPDITLWRPKQ